MIMNKITPIIAISIVMVAIIIIPVMTEQFADAKSRKKIDFTQTIISSTDPGQGHEGHQLALILSPNTGTLYDGSLTYTASETVQIVVLHEISKDDVKGQPTWTVDEDTIYALSLIEPGTSAGSFEFSGSALALHTPNTNEFAVTVSVDGWIRCQPTEVIMQKIEVEKDEPSLKLSRTNVPATIPMHKGLYEGGEIFYIITDSSGQQNADLISEKQGWKVELAPALSETPDSALGDVYMFTSGLDGNGTHGYQDEVFSNTPTQSDEYSALRKVIHVEWKLGQNAEILDSVEKIKEVEEDGRITLNATEAILNMPQIKWPDGQMVVENKTISDDMPYGEAQIVDINSDNMTVTFIAHRGWGPDGQTIYYIVTDATPTGPAEMMGVVDSPTSTNLITSTAAVDLFQFKNGIKGSGPIGFQPGIAAAAPGDETYSPMWRIFLVEWNNPNNARVLETRADIDFYQSEESIMVSLARPMNSDHIVNCPFIDPFQ